MNCKKCKNLYFENKVQGYACKAGVDIYSHISHNVHDCDEYEDKTKPRFSKKQKEENRIIKAYNNLGYNNGQCKTKSDLDLIIAETNEALFFSNQKIEEYTEMKEKATSLLCILQDIENEYEKEILREFNPNLTIY